MTIYSISIVQPNRTFRERLVDKKYYTVLKLIKLEWARRGRAWLGQNRNSAMQFIVGTQKKASLQQPNADAPIILIEINNLKVYR